MCVGECLFLCIVKILKNDTFKVNLGLKMEPLVAQKGKEGQDRFLQADVGILAQLWVSEELE